MVVIKVQRNAINHVSSNFKHSNKKTAKGNKTDRYRRNTLENYLLIAKRPLFFFF